MAADPQDRWRGLVPDDVGGVALVLAGVCGDVQVDDVELRVAVSGRDEEAAGRVVNVLGMDGGKVR